MAVAIAVVAGHLRETEMCAQIAATVMTTTGEIAQDRQDKGSCLAVPLGPTMRCSRRRGTPSPFQALLSGAADLVSLGFRISRCNAVRMLGGSFLFFGPAGCGKTLLASAIVGELDEWLRTLSASDIPTKPRATLENVFAQIENSLDIHLLIEDIDEVFVDLRRERTARRYLLDKIRNRRPRQLVLATTRRPELLLPDELSVFSDIIPLFYADEKGRLDILEIHVRKRQITLPSGAILTDVATKTEWWSGKELEDLIVQSHDSKQCALSLPSLNKALSENGQRVIVRSRENRTRELLQFTKEHCTNRDILEELEARFTKLGDSGPPHIGLQLTLNIVRTTIMGDTYKIGQVGAAGPGSASYNATFNQRWNDVSATVNLSELAEQLSRLRHSLLKEANEAAHDIAIAEIASAENEAKKGNGSRVLEHLAKAGKWTFDVATRIGERVAAALIRDSMGLS